MALFGRARTIQSLMPKADHYRQNTETWMGLRLRRKGGQFFWLYVLYIMLLCARVLVLPCGFEGQCRVKYSKCVLSLGCHADSEHPGEGRPGTDEFTSPWTSLYFSPAGRVQIILFHDWSAFPLISLFFPWTGTLRSVVFLSRSIFETSACFIYSLCLRPGSLPVIATGLKLGPGRASTTPINMSGSVCACSVCPAFAILFLVILDVNTAFS